MEIPLDPIPLDPIGAVELAAVVNLLTRHLCDDYARTHGLERIEQLGLAMFLNRIYKASEELYSFEPEVN